MHGITKSERVQPFKGTIQYKGAGFDFYAEILPARKPAHVGADHPRFGDVGHPAYCLRFTLSDSEGQPVYLGNFFDFELREIREAILDEWKLDQTADQVLVVLGAVEHGRVSA